MRIIINYRLEKSIALFLVFAVFLLGEYAQAKGFKQDFEEKEISTLEISNFPGTLKFEKAQKNISLDGYGFDKTDLKVEKIDQTLKISFKGDESDKGEGVKVLNNGSILVYANGTKIKQSVLIGENTSEITDGKKLKLTICLPGGKNLNVSSYHDILSDVSFHSISLKLLGVSHVDMQNTNAGELNVDQTGNTRLVVKGLSDAIVTAAVSGIGELDVSGSFKHIDASVSGSSSVSSHGKVFGNYIMDLSGASSVNHKGVICGQVKKRISGISEFKQEK